ALIIPHVVDVNSYHTQIQNQLEKKLGRRISLGRMNLSLFPPSFQVQNAIVGEDNSFPTSHPFAEIETLSVSVKLLPLLHKQVDINSLQLNRPHIEIVRNVQGNGTLPRLALRLQRRRQQARNPQASLNWPSCKSTTGKL